MTQRPARTTDKYNIVENRNQERPQKNEIRITGVPRVSKYITYAATLIKEKEPKVVLKGTGQAIKNVCLVAEILRNGIQGLHQLVEVKTATVIDEYHPKEEGLDIVKVTKYLPLLEIALFLDPVVAKVDTKKPGYQSPLEKVSGDLLEKAGERRRGPPRGRGGRGRGRGGRGFRRGGYGQYRSRGGYGNRRRSRSRSYSEEDDRKGGRRGGDRSRSRSGQRRPPRKHSGSRSRSRSDERDYKRRPQQHGGGSRSRSRSGGRYPRGGRGGFRPRGRGSYRSRGGGYQSGGGYQKRE